MQAALGQERGNLSELSAAFSFLNSDEGKSLKLCQSQCELWENGHPCKNVKNVSGDSVSSAEGERESFTAIKKLSEGAYLRPRAPP